MAWSLRPYVGPAENAAEHEFEVETQNLVDAEHELNEREQAVIEKSEETARELAELLGGNLSVSIYGSHAQIPSPGDTLAIYITEVPAGTTVAQPQAQAAAAATANEPSMTTSQALAQSEEPENATTAPSAEASAPDSSGGVPGIQAAPTPMATPGEQESPTQPAPSSGEPSAPSPVSPSVPSPVSSDPSVSPTPPAAPETPVAPPVQPVDPSAPPVAEQPGAPAESVPPVDSSPSPDPVAPLVATEPPAEEVPAAPVPEEGAATSPAATAPGEIPVDLSSQPAPVAPTPEAPSSTPDVAIGDVPSETAPVDPTTLSGISDQAAQESPATPPVDPSAPVSSEPVAPSSPESPSATPTDVPASSVEASEAPAPPVDPGVQPVVVPAGQTASVEAGPGVSAPATPEEQGAVAVAVDPATGKPLYFTSSTDPVDTGAWLQAAVNTPEGAPLFTFVNDVAGSVPQGDGSGGIWHTYSGPVVPVSPPAAG